MALNFSNIGEEGTAPFNMALNTLEKIHKILLSIFLVSSRIVESQELSEGEAQHMKYRLVRQLYIQSVPLLRAKNIDEWKEQTWKLIKEIKLKWKPIKDGDGFVRDYVEAIDPEIEDTLDDITKFIEEKLQEEGYFMPPKHDPRFSWSEK